MFKLRSVGKILYTGRVVRVPKPKNPMPDKIKRPTNSKTNEQK